MNSTASYDPAEAAQNGETGVQFADFTGVVSDNGVIKFRLQKTDTTAGGHLNVFELNAVPEPSAFALFGLGIGVIVLRRRRA